MQTATTDWVGDIARFPCPTDTLIHLALHAHGPGGIGDKQTKAGPDSRQFCLSPSESLRCFRVKIASAYCVGIENNPGEIVIAGIDKLYSDTLIESGRIYHSRLTEQLVESLR